MAKTAFAATSIWLCLIQSSSVATAANLEDWLAAFAVSSALCSSIKEDKERLSCLDKLNADFKASVATAAETASTKDMLASFKPGDFKIVDADDMHVAPRKFLNKPVEVKNVRCFYADKEDYRCIPIGSGMVTAFFVEKVGPDAERDRLENDCGSIKTAMSSIKCTRTIRLLPNDFGEDTVSGNKTRIVVKAKKVQIIVPPAPAAVVNRRR